MTLWPCGTTIMNKLQDSVDNPIPMQLDQGLKPVLVDPGVVIYHPLPKISGVSLYF